MAVCHMADIPTVTFYNKIFLAGRTSLANWLSFFSLMTVILLVTIHLNNLSPTTW